MTDVPKNPFDAFMQKSKAVEETKPVESTALVPVNPLSQLLGDPTPMKVESGSKMLASGPHDLAEINTQAMTPKSVPMSGIMLKTAQRTEELKLDSAASVRELCDNIDVLLEANEQLVGPPLFELRNYVQRLMVTLSTNPEFDSVIHDKETRNVMRFVRAAREEAESLRTVKTVKKAIREVKKLGKPQIDQGAFAAAFANVMAKGFGKK